MLYRLLTERKNVAGVQKIVLSRFAGCTMLYGTGYWRGGQEKNLTIEIDTEATNKPRILEVVEAIKRLNNQEAVGLQEIQSVTSFV